MPKIIKPRQLSSYEKQYHYSHPQEQPKTKYGGLIRSLNLEDFWNSLSESERRYIKQCYKQRLGGDGESASLDSPSRIVEFTTQTASNFLSAYATWAINDKKYNLAEKMLKESLKRVENPIDEHFTYNHLIDLYYKQREKGPEYLQKCITCCLKDIQILSAFKSEWNKKYGDAEKLKIPSLTRLAIIYEKQGLIQEAINICQKALELGFINDGTKSGFQGRLERLQRKLEKQQEELTQ